MRIIGKVIQFRSREEWDAEKQNRIRNEWEQYLAWEEEKFKEKTHEPKVDIETIKLSNNGGTLTRKQEGSFVQLSVELPYEKPMPKKLMEFFDEEDEY